MLALFLPTPTQSLPLLVLIPLSRGNYFFVQGYLAATLSTVRFTDYYPFVPVPAVNCWAVIIRPLRTDDPLFVKALGILYSAI
jgi:hypothetical protein